MGSGWRGERVAGAVLGFGEASSGLYLSCTWSHRTCRDAGHGWGSEHVVARRLPFGICTAGSVWSGGGVRVQAEKLMGDKVLAGTGRTGERALRAPSSVSSSRGGLRSAALWGWRNYGSAYGRSGPHFLFEQREKNVWAPAPGEGNCRSLRCDGSPLGEPSSVGMTTVD